MMDSLNGPFKKMPEVVVTEQDVDSSKVTSSLDAHADAWVPGAKKRMPYFGFGALLAVILASIGQVLVLLFADARSASDWPAYITPNVCLSILNGISSLAITFAVMQGIAIAWWRRALMGASIKELHYTWNFSTSVTTIFFKYKYFNAIALAALMTKVAIIDGVLFQRSIGTYITISWKDPEPGSVGTNNVSAFSTEQFPPTGYWGAGDGSSGLMTGEFSWVVSQWINTGYGVNTWDFVEHCDGIACMYGLPGVGFQVECEETNSTNTFVNTAPSNPDASNSTIFSVEFALLHPDTTKNYSRIEMSTYWPVGNEDPNYELPTTCPTLFTTSRCELRPAVMNYTVFYTNTDSVEQSKLKEDPENNRGISALGGDGSQLSYSCWNATIAQWGLGSYFSDDGCGLFNASWKQIQGVQVNRTLSIYEPWKAGSNSSLLGIYMALRDAFGSEAVLSHENSSWSVSQSGALASANQGMIPEKDTFCNYTYYKPVEEIIRRLNILMLQTSVDYSFWPSEMWWDDATGESIWPQNVPSKQYFKDIYFSTDMKFMGCALGLTLFVILCILPSYWGFWQLGRDVTLGPFEIAYAFQGPAFSSVHGVDGRADQVVKNVGRTRVQYGEVEDGDRKRLAFKLTEMPPSQAR